MAIKNEKHLEKILVDICNANGIETLKSESLCSGFVDRMVFANDIHYIELKSDTYYRRKKTQEIWAKNIIKSNGKYFMIETLEELKAYAKTHLNIDI